MIGWNGNTMNKNKIIFLILIAAGFLLVLLEFSAPARYAGENEKNIVDLLRKAHAYRKAHPVVSGAINIL